MIKKINIIIISLAIVTITIEIARGNKPWKPEHFPKIKKELNENLEKDKKKEKLKTVSKLKVSYCLLT